VKVINPAEAHISCGERRGSWAFLREVNMAERGGGGKRPYEQGKCNPLHGAERNRQEKGKGGVPPQGQTLGKLRCGGASPPSKGKRSRGGHFQVSRQKKKKKQKKGENGGGGNSQGKISKENVGCGGKRKRPRSVRAKF